MPTYRVVTQSMIEMDENGNPAVNTIAVEASSAGEAALVQIADGYFVLSVEPLEDATSGRPRIQVDLLASNFEDPDDYNHQAMLEILRDAGTLHVQRGEDVFIAEVQYRDRLTGEWEDWDKTGDLLRFDFSTPEPTCTTEPSEVSE